MGLKTISNSGRNIGYSIHKGFLFFVLLVLVTSGCTSYRHQLVEKGNAILARYGLEGSITLEPKSFTSDSWLRQTGYDLYITSDGFEDKSNKEKSRILSTLERIKVSKIKINKGTSHFIYNAYISSAGFVYSLGSENRLLRDGEVFPPVHTMPTATPFVYPAGDFSLSWDTYDPTYNSLGGILTITRRNGDYSMRLVMNDGSEETYDLHVISETPLIQVTDRPGNPYGDFMEIGSFGRLNFYDEQGLIYYVFLLK